MLNWHEVKNYDTNLMGWANRDNGVDIPEIGMTVLLIFPEPSDGRIYEGRFKEATISNSAGFYGKDFDWTMINGVKWAIYNRPD